MMTPGLRAEDNLSQFFGSAVALFRPSTGQKLGICFQDDIFSGLAECQRMDSHWTTLKKY